MPKEVNKKQNKEKKEKKHFMKDFKAELKKVIWPTPKQLLNNTTAVITIVLITAIIVFALDFAFEKMNQYGIEKIKSVVVTESSEENNISDGNVVMLDSNTTDQNTQNSNEVTENSENK